MSTDLKPVSDWKLLAVTILAALGLSVVGAAGFYYTLRNTRQVQSTNDNGR